MNKIVPNKCLIYRKVGYPKYALSRMVFELLVCIFVTETKA